MKTRSWPELHGSGVKLIFRQVDNFGSFFFTSTKANSLNRPKKKEFSRKGCFSGTGTTPHSRPHDRAVKHRQSLDACHERHNCIIHWNGDKPWRKSDVNSKPRVWLGC